MPEPKVLISILNWNAPESTSKTVRSVLLSNYDNYKILLLDNNSGDNSVSFLSTLFPEIELIKMKSNLGYAGAHKASARLALKENYDLLWILNNDVEVFPSTLTELVNASKKNGEALLGSIGLEPNNRTINFGGGLEMLNESVTNDKLGYNIYAGKYLDEVEIEERAVSGVQGSSFMIPVNVIKKYGFMNTRFFLYGEETEYCYRLRNKFGVQSIIVPTSRVIHEGEGSFKPNEKLKWIGAYYSTRNNNLVHKKYQKENKINEMSVRRLPHYLKYFFKHFFLISVKEKDFDYWLNYYAELGNFHSFLKLKGKYLEPEKFLK